MTSILSADAFKNYQLVLALDISGSMNEKEKEYDGETRIKFVKEQISSLAEQLSKYDPDGLDLITFNKKVKVYPGMKSAAVVTEKFEEIKAMGGTNTAGAVAKAFELHRGYQAKNPEHKSTIVLVLTDGKPSSEEELKDKIVEIGKAVNDQAEIAFSFLQVGSDPDAKEFLKKLDDLKEKKGYKDIVDTKSFYDLCEGDTLSIEKVLASALND